MNRYRPWLELCRLPGVFTAMADPLAGALVAGAGWRQALSVAALMLASACLYAAGAALNDWADYRKDLLAKPWRPLPSRRIRRFMALLLAVGLLILGGLLTWAPGPDTARIGALLVGAILAHDILMKNLPAAPVVLSGCRALNLLLGMVLVPASNSSPPPMRVYLLVAMALYVLGLGLFAAGDNVWGTARRLAAGSTLTWLAIIAVALLQFFFPEQASGFGGTAWVVLVLAATGYRMSQAIFTPKPQNVQIAVATAAFGTIVLEAAMVAATRGLLASLLVMLLLPPALWAAERLGTTAVRRQPSTRTQAETPPLDTPG